jgi:DNA-binding LytR/AlgR family response regulator
MQSRRWIDETLLTPMGRTKTLQLSDLTRIQYLETAGHLVNVHSDDVTYYPQHKARIKPICTSLDPSQLTN